METLSGQDLLDYFAKSVNVKYEVVTNFSRPYESKITFSNGGDHSINDDGWSIYSYHLCQIETDNPEINIEHEVGGLFKWTPTNDFKALRPCESLEVAIAADEPTVSRSVIFPNWYVTKPGLQPRVIESTADESRQFVSDFKDKKTWKKRETDESNPFTPEERYEKSVVENLGNATIPILPTPLDVKLDPERKLVFSDHKWIVVSTNDKFENEATMLSEYLDTRVVKSIDEIGDMRAIEFSTTKTAHLSSESYEICIELDPPMINVCADAPAGMFYAVQSLMSLIEHCAGAKKIIKCGKLIDSPRFPYRGFHIDVARNFVEAKEIMKLIRVMSAYKMNNLHLHLTDDEGWRIEIEGLPELTEVGAKRDHNLAKDGYAIEPTLGSGPSSTSKFYSATDYQDILKCAVAHHVKVIPEIDMPGHSYAAIAAMTARYNFYKSKGNVDLAEEYLLVDLKDESSYTSVQKYTNNTMNPCLRGTKNFVKKIIHTMMDLHEPVQPLTIFHVGGDEVPIGAWDGSEVCAQFFRDALDLNNIISDSQEDEIISRERTAAIQEYFTEYVEEVCHDEMLLLAVWNDGVRDATLKPNCGIPRLVHAWRISKKNDRYNPNVLANSGYHIIISSATHTYFDHPYEPDPEENGLTWCVRMADTKTVFGMKPYDMYNCQSEDFNVFDHKKLEKKSNIFGIQSQIWGELIRSPDKLEYMLFPRLLAIAERAWHQGKWEESMATTEMEKDWCNFANTLGYKELRRLDSMGIHFRIPPPGVKKSGDKVYIGCSYPNITFKYKQKGDTSWKDALNGMSTNNFKKGQSYEFVSCFGQRMSRVILAMF